MNNIPNLFIVGFPRCGTTSLYYYLSQHPDIFMSEPKEPHYLCSDINKESDKYHGKQLYHPIRNESEYLKFFSTAKDEKVIGEASVLNIYSEEAPKNIKNLNSDAKIIICIREPIDFLESYYQTAKISYFDNMFDFETELKLEHKRKNGEYFPSKILYPRHLLYSEKASFSKHIEKYLKSFPVEQMKVVSLDELKDDPLKSLKRIFEFLEVENYSDIDFSNKNPKKEIKTIFLHKIIRSIINNRSSMTRKIFLKILPYNFLKKTGEKIMNLNTTRKEKENLNPEFKKELMKQYKPEVEKLNRLLHENGLIENDRDLVKERGYDKI